MVQMVKQLVIIGLAVLTAVVVSVVITISSIVFYAAHILPDPESQQSDIITIPN